MVIANKGMVCCGGGDTVTKLLRGGSLFSTLNRTRMYQLFAMTNEGVRPELKGDLAAPL